ncbi:hypothetical protein ACEYW6_10610 [Nostoc sp. UIC 10607]|uniref:hypothetical protein n=1 Tax=Nostoc sp. UIC 10607 TaxID=3045935 RepID=UPI0039A387B2
MENDIETKNAKAMAVGLAVLGLIISIPFAWNSYDQYKQREQARQNCEKLRSLRTEIVRRMQSGQQISPLEASAALQIGVMTPEDCAAPLP